MTPDARAFTLKAPNDLHLALTEIGGSHYNSFSNSFSYPATSFVASAISKLASRSNCPLSSDGAFARLLERHKTILGWKPRFINAEQLDQPLVRKEDSWLWQCKAYHIAMGLDACMWWLGPGTGKSKTLIDIIQNNGHRKVVLAMPNHILKDENCWDRQFENYCKIDFMLEFLDYGSAKKSAERAQAQMKKFEGSSTPLIIAINYDSIWRGHLAELLLSWKPDLFALDESHKIKAPGGKASRYCARLGIKSKQRIELTGTMMPNSQLDAYGQYRTLDPGIFGTSYNRFLQRYAIIYQHNNVPIIQGYKNQQELAEKIDPITVQIDSNVLDLPEPQHDSRVFDLSPEERKVYDELEQQYSAQTQQGYITITNGLTKVLRLQQLTGGWLPLREDDVEAQLKRIGSSKQNLLRDLMEDIDPNEPIVVYARFTADLDSVRAATLDLKRTYGEISGRAYDKELWDKGELQVLGINVKSAEGLDTLKRAQYGIFYSIGYSNGEFEQCWTRLRRPGMRNFCYFYHLVARNTVDGAVYRALKKKQNAREEIVRYLKTLARAA